MALLNSPIPPSLLQHCSLEVCSPQKCHQAPNAQCLINIAAASTTKAFTAAAMSLLCDDDSKHPNVRWTTPVYTLIRDDFVLKDEYATSHSTIEDILSHRTGIPSHNFSYGGTHEAKIQTLKDVVRSLRHFPMTTELRSKYQYSNIAFATAAYIIETLEGVSLGDFLRERIWEREFSS